MTSMGKLPLEVVDAIVEKLCLHCTKITERLDGYQRKNRMAALTSLCLTSRALNQVATRHLYHRPDCAKWWLLAKTLIARKELRSQVKHLVSTGWKLNDEGGLLEHIEVISENERATLLPGYTAGETDGGMQIMCNLCPNVERLEVNDGEFENYFFRPPGSMTEVTYLEVTADDPEYGFNIAELGVLFRAAPNIATLVCNEAGNCGDLPVTLSRVTRLDLDWCDLTAEAFECVLGHCPNLERLRYISKGFAYEASEPFTPRDAKEIIERSRNHLKRLKSFHLDMRQCEPEYCWMDEEVDVEEELEEAKEALTALGIDFTFKA